MTIHVSGTFCLEINVFKDMDLDLNDVCRLCARKRENMQNIFQDISAESESFMDITKDMSGMLPLKIASATSIKV